MAKRGPKSNGMRILWAIKGLGDLVLAYIFGSWALDTARYWYYLLCLFFTWLGIWFLARAIKNDRK